MYQDGTNNRNLVTFPAAWSNQNTTNPDDGSTNPNSTVEDDSYVKADDPDPDNLPDNV